MRKPPLDHPGANCSAGARCAADLRAAVDGAERVLRAIDEAASGRRPAPDTWSPREVIGHLVDSASNNHRRFVMGQVQEDLRFPGYDQEAWVSVQRYRDEPWANLVTLWASFNRHLAHVIEAAPDEVMVRPRESHNLPEIGWKLPAEGQPATLAHIVSDYIAHLRHHLAQVGLKAQDSRLKVPVEVSSCPNPSGLSPKP